MSAPLLRLAGVSKAYGHVQAIEDVDFDVSAGEVVALVGDNGAGKSTLVKVIAGAHRPDSGIVWFGGQERDFHAPLDAKRLGIEVVYQSLGLLENLTVAGNIFIGREERVRLLGRRTPLLATRTMNRRSREILERYNVAVDRPQRPVYQLSGGQRQMIAIVRSASFGSQLLVMDEPTAALGVQESAKVLDLVGRLREQGVPVVIVSHNLEHVFGIADRIVVMRRGRVAGTVRTADSSPQEVVLLITGANAPLASA